MDLSPDQVIYWQHGFFKLNSTLVNTWVLMGVLALGSWLVTRRLSSRIKVSRWQVALEVVVLAINDQIAEMGLKKPERYLPFIGTLFIFIAAANLGALIPGFVAPTGSLSTTTSLALCVFMAVPVFGITSSGLKGYLATYLDPTPLMLPFNLISEGTRTLALAVRLFGNIMSGTMIIGILVSIAPLLFPVIMSALGLLTGMVQAYIFSILATVFIAAATQGGEDRARTKKKNPQPVKTT